MTISSTGNLSSYFTSLITNIITVDSQPLTRAQKARDQVSVRRNLFNQVNTKLGDLQSSVRTLISSNANYAFGSRAHIQGHGPDGSTVLTASAASSAAVGRYAISVTSLAAAHRVHGDAHRAREHGARKRGELHLERCGDRGREQRHPHRHRRQHQQRRLCRRSGRARQRRRQAPGLGERKRAAPAT